MRVAAIEAGACGKVCTCVTRAIRDKDFAPTCTWSD